MYQYLNLFGKEIPMVIVSYAVGALLIYINFVLKRERYNYSKIRALCYPLLFITAGMIEFYIMGVVKSAVMGLISGGEYVPGISLRLFGVTVFQPVFIFVLSLLTGEKFRKFIDSIAPETFISFVFGKLACLFKGCCYGYPDENGVKSVVYGGKVFPVQLYEAITIVFVVAIVAYLSKKNCKFNLRTGSLFPIGTILYSIGRFFWEYFRYYDSEWEKNILLGMNFWQICCVIVSIVSVIWLIILYKSPKYEYCSFEPNPDVFVTKLETKYYARKAEKEKAKRKKTKEQKNIQHRKKRK